jgi:hypothetical protein
MIGKRAYAAGVAIAALAFVVGCTDRVNPTAPEQNSGHAPLSARVGQQPQQYWTSGDEFARVARAEVPGSPGSTFKVTAHPLSS